MLQYSESMTKYLRRRNSPSRAEILRMSPPNWLIVDTFCAPVDAWKRRRDQGHATIEQTDKKTY
jgi:hypothetical protein